MLPSIALAALAITLNGRPISPPPQTLVINGRTYLPVRALGRALGASVDYRAATHDVIVDRNGQRAMLHAPQMLAGRAYAPLRVAANSFGIDVIYHAAERTIALTTPPGAPPAAVARTIRAALVTPKFPQPGAQIPDGYPAISALVAPQGGSAVDPNAIRLHVDGNDVTANATVLGNQIVYTSHTPLANGVHSVHVDGVDRDGVPFAGDWSFTSSYSPPSAASSVSAETGLNSVYVDRMLGAGDRYFEVIAYGPAGGYGYVTIDGVPGFYNFAQQGIGRYVAHVSLPLGIDQPYAHAYVHYTDAAGRVMNYTIPATFQVYTLYPAHRVFAPPVAAPQPTPFPTLDPATPRRGVIRRTPAPVASRVPLTTASTSPSPSPTATPLTHKRRLLGAPRPVPTLSPKPTASP